MFEKDKDYWKHTNLPKVVKDEKNVPNYEFNKPIVATTSLLAEKLSDIKNKIAKLEVEAKNIQTTLIALMNANDETTGSFFKGNVKYSVTLVKGTRTVVDEAKIKEMVSPDVWEKIVYSKVDNSKLTAAIISGEIDTATAADAIDEVEIKPYVKITESKVRVENE